MVLLAIKHFISVVDYQYVEPKKMSVIVINAICIDRVLTH